MFEIKNIILTHGSESYLIEKNSNEIIDKLVDKNFYEFNVSKFEFDDLNIEKLYNSIQTLPLMSDNKVVIIENMPLDKGAISKYKTVFEELGNIITNVPPSTYLIINSSAEKLFNGKFLKKFKEVGDINVVNKLNRPDLMKYISNYLGIKQSDNIKLINYIVDNSGYLITELKMTLLDLNNELDKIKNLNLNASDKDIIDTLTKISGYNIFNLTDSILEKSLKKSLTIYNTLIDDNDDAFIIFYMVVRMIRNILIIKECRRRGMNNMQITKRYSISNFELKKLERFINIWTYKELKDAINSSYELEVGLKSKPIKPEIQVENYITNLCS